MAEAARGVEEGEARGPHVLGEAVLERQVPDDHEGAVEEAAEQEGGEEAPEPAGDGAQRQCHGHRGQQDECLGAGGAGPDAAAVDEAGRDAGDGEDPGAEGVSPRAVTTGPRLRYR
ncbi:hypothetical protein AB0N31_05080 [Streptomyces sp. NPDC051051]|uniref:hypothetical protein n=1 Tax=Streptomyces sp. NPDC051051 TaxID=3155666 RepID=UPI003436A607